MANANIRIEPSGKVVLPDGTEVHAVDFQEQVSNNERGVKWYWKYSSAGSGKVVLPDGTEVYAADV